MQTGMSTLTHGMKHCRAPQVDKLVCLYHRVVVLEHGEPVPQHASTGHVPHPGTQPQTARMGAGKQQEQSHGREGTWQICPCCQTVMLGHGIYLNGYASAARSHWEMVGMKMHA